MKLPVFRVACIVVSLVVIITLIILSIPKPPKPCYFCMMKQGTISFTKEDISKAEAYAKAHNKNEGEKQ